MAEEKTNDWSQLYLHYGQSFQGFRDFLADYLMVQPRGGVHLVPFQLLPAQDRTLDAMQRQYEDQGYIRLIVLKARRLGMSTLACAWLYWMSVFHRHTSCTVMSQLDSTNTELWKFIELFREFTPTPFRLPLSTDQARLLWSKERMSGLKCLTAGAYGKTGRGGTNQGLLLTEAAWYPGSMDWKAGILATVSQERGTFVAIESTANGVGNDYEIMWRKAVAGKIDYIPVFEPWHGDPRNREDDEKTAKIFAVNPLYTRSEQELEDEHGVDKNQLAWRRNQMAILERSANKGDPEDSFHQEHPSTADEAFLTSGRKRFSFARIRAAERFIKDPVGRFEIRLELINDGRKSRPRLRAADNGRLTVYAMPRPDHEYAVGADVAEGLAHGDNSVAYVVSMSTGDVVAVWSGKVEPTPFGDILVAICKWYGAAGKSRRVEAIVEVNNVGKATVDRMQMLKYPHIWQREEEDGPEGRKVKKNGFRTMKNTKPVIINGLNNILIDYPHMLRSKQLLDEMGWFMLIDNENNPNEPPQMRAADGKNDDHVMAAALVYAKLVIPALERGEIKSMAPKPRMSTREAKRRGIEQGHAEAKYRTWSAAGQASGRVKTKPSARLLDEMLKRAEQLMRKNPYEHHKPAERDEGWEKRAEAANAPRPKPKHRKFGG